MVLKMKDITVQFPGVLAVDRADLSVQAGEVRAVVGENGAGKSTLMKVLAGIYPAGQFTGEIEVAGQAQAFDGVRASEDAGIAMIPQDLNLADDLTVAENMFLNRLPLRNGLVDEAQLFAAAQAQLESLGADFGPSIKAGELGVAQKQMVAIAAALSKQVRVLILDEPTSTLSNTESEILFAKIAELSSQGIACLYISHRLDEVLRICDTVTVMRDGAIVATKPVEGLSERDMVHLMIGRELDDYYPEGGRKPGEVILSVKDIHVSHPTVPEKLLVDGASFELRKGEVLGIFGLVGSGRTEMANALLGVGTNVSFSSYMLGELDLSAVSHPKEALRRGLGYLPEDRKKFAAIPQESVNHNISVASLRDLTRGPFIDEHKEYSRSDDFREQYKIKTANLDAPVSTLSGGNQQKVMLARLMACDLSVAVLDEPTQGVDVGAKSEIYDIIDRLASGGLSILMISSDLPEVLGMSDRILVMHRGRIVADMDAAQADQKSILELATIGSTEEKV